MGRASIFTIVFLAHTLHALADADAGAGAGAAAAAGCSTDGAGSSTCAASSALRSKEARASTTGVQRHAVVEFHTTDVFTAQVTNATELNKKLRLFLRVCRALEAGKPAPKRSNDGGFQTHTHILSHLPMQLDEQMKQSPNHPQLPVYKLATEGIRELGDTIAGAVHKFVHTMFPDQSPIDEIEVSLTAVWFGVNQKGHFNKPHNHGSANFAGVYYVDDGGLSAHDVSWSPTHEHSIGANDGRLIFLDPRNAHPPTLGPHEGFGTNFAVAPRSGRMLLFPGYLQHVVNPHPLATDRIAVSFNVNMQVKRYPTPKRFEFYAQGRPGYVGGQSGEVLSWDEMFDSVHDAEVAQLWPTRAVVATLGIAAADQLRESLAEQAGIQVAAAQGQGQGAGAGHGHGTRTELTPKVLADLTCAVDLFVCESRARGGSLGKPASVQPMPLPLEAEGPEKCPTDCGELRAQSPYDLERGSGRWEQSQHPLQTLGLWDQRADLSGVFYTGPGFLVPYDKSTQREQTRILLQVPTSEHAIIQAGRGEVMLFSASTLSMFDVEAQPGEAFCFNLWLRQSKR